MLLVVDTGNTNTVMAGPVGAPLERLLAIFPLAHAPPP